MRKKNDRLETIIKGDPIDLQMAHLDLTYRLREAGVIDEGYLSAFAMMMSKTGYKLMQEIHKDLTDLIVKEGENSDENSVTDIN